MQALREAAIAAATSEEPLSPPPPMRPMREMGYEQQGPAPLASLQSEQDMGSSELADIGASEAACSSRGWFGLGAPEKRPSVANLTLEERLRRTLGQKPQEDDCLTRLLPDLSWDDRLLGFLGCFCVGCALSLSSMFSFTLMLSGYPAQFALKLSAGNVLSICSASFLAGPRSQLDKMRDPSRIGATLMYVSSIVATLTAAFVIKMALVTIIAIVCQMVALFWYGVSFIPYGRHLVKSCVGRVCKSGCGSCADGVGLKSLV